jgi:hypothetical protein
MLAELWIVIVVRFAADHIKSKRKSRRFADTFGPGSVNLRAEAFNVFNHPNFVGYVSTWEMERRLRQILAHP